MIKMVVDGLAPALVACQGVGYGAVSQLLITAGATLARLRSEALCGVNPIPASSTTSAQPGGDRAANSALHIIAIGRLRLGPRTQDHAFKRTGQGLSKLEALRCLKRYIAREIFYILRSCNQSINQVQTAA